jgi:hypothetical protein
MPISPEEWEAIARTVEERNAKLPPLSPESQARVDSNMAALAELEAKGPRRQVTGDQAKIWQEWTESEIRRIDRKHGETPE